MPMPKPGQDESQDDFMSRCHSEMSEEFPDESQRNAVCMSQWESAAAPGAPIARYPNVLKFVSMHPWAMRAAALDVVIEVLSLHASGRISSEDVRARVMAAAPRPGIRAEGLVAVLPLHGMIAPRANVMTDMSGGTSAEVWGKQFARVLSNPEVGAIVVDVDSEGGNVFGIEELAGQIHAARGRKPIVAVANHLMASAAYWLGSQADRVFVTPSSQTGSIGVVAIHEDMSKAAERAGVTTTLVTAGEKKGQGSPFGPLSDAARADLQKRVDGYYEAFTRDVARGRGVNVKQVREGFGKGGVLSAKEAVREGVADAVGTLDQAIAWAAGQLGGDPRAAARAAAAEDEMRAKVKAQVESVRKQLQARA